MVIIKRGKMVYYVKENAVIVGINDFQYLAYTIYPLRNKKPFYSFKKKILKSKDSQYNNEISLVSLANVHGLIGVSATRPKEASNIYG